MRLRHLMEAGVSLVAATAMFTPVAAYARGNPGNGGGGGGRPPNAGTESVGNNLSNPVIFAEGYGITGLSSESATASPPWQQAWTGLRIPSLTNPTLATGTDGTYTAGTVTYYLQGVEQNSWQAGWVNGRGQPAYPVYVKWGDNVLGTLAPSSGGSTPWTTTSTIHLEVAMQSTTALPGDSLLEYFPTQALYGSGSTEVYGTTGQATSAANVTPNVYSDSAYLEIRQVADAQGTPVETAPIHVLATWNRSVEGPSSNALIPEVNAGGNVDYSYNWFTGRDRLAAGYYELTFGVANGATSPAGAPPVPGNALIAGVVAPGATEGESGAPVACDATSLQIPLTCSTSANQSSVVIHLVSGTTSGGGGGRGGGVGGGGGGGVGGGGGRGAGGRGA